MTKYFEIWHEVLSICRYSLWTVYHCWSNNGVTWLKKGSKIWRMHYLHKCLQLLSMLTPINIAIRIGKDYRYCIDKVLIIRTWQLAPTSHIFTRIIIRQKVSLLNDKEENALLMESTCAGFDFQSWSALTFYSISLFWFSKLICINISFFFI